MNNRWLPVLAIIAAIALAACTTVTVTTPAPAASAPAASVPAATASAASGTGVCAPSTEVGPVQATMADRTFIPSTITAKVGDVITWTNTDTTTHTATLRDDPACTTPNLGTNDTGGLTFSAPGTYAFVCKIHSDMTGTIEVTS
jgi:plastocyanin